MGTIPTALMAVTMKDESVISRISHPRAIMVIKKEVMETREAAQKMRNWGFARARRGPLPPAVVGLPSERELAPLGLMGHPRFRR